MPALFEFTRGSTLAEQVSSWMAIAKQVAVGGYRQVLEDGPDVCPWKATQSTAITVRTFHIRVDTLRTCWD
jgi:hypothetical protein